jgi:hypothetical protein
MVARAPPGTWLDLDTRHGRLRDELDALPPEPDQPTVEVRAGSGFGDITIRRSEAAAGAAGQPAPA